MRKTRRALEALADALGENRVAAGEVAAANYTDPFSVRQTSPFASAAVAPETSAEVQTVVKIANRFGVALWPISRGKNLGYGGSAPILPGSIVVDLSRMTRIHSVDPRLGIAVIEPGVGYADLYRYLRTNKIPLWMSIPGNPEGSILGNALERGIGSGANGDHVNNICGLEVVLPDGDIARTGMGAMGNSRTWHHYKGGFGPSLDQLFVQSNFGIVTKVGLWLAPEPECTLQAQLKLPAEEDLGWAVEALAGLRLRNVIEHPVIIGNFLHQAATFCRRSDWFDGDGALPPEVARLMMERYKLGWWNTSITLFGYERAIKAHSDVVRDAFRGRTFEEITFAAWHRGDPLDRSGVSTPDFRGMEVTNWRGKHGAHLDFSPILPPDGELVGTHARRMRSHFEEHGLDYHASFTVGPRYVSNINMLIFDSANPRMIEKVRALFEIILHDTAREGLGAYRAHIDYMDNVADTYEYNNHALRRLAERIKDAIDPRGLLAPGKSGIWPRAYRPRSYRRSIT
jgi:4-cresol dehydrogenase (hydroxylating)